jgi:hypothetical protein
MKPLDEQINAFALHLIEQEAEVPTRSNKCSIKEHEKFLQSRGWLFRKLLLVHAALKGSSIRILSDKNRYTQGRYVQKGISHRVTIKGVLDLMDILRYVQFTERGHFDRSSGIGVRQGKRQHKPSLSILKVYPALYQSSLLVMRTQILQWFRLPLKGRWNGKMTSLSSSQ